MVRSLQYLFIAIIVTTVGFSLYQWNASRASQTLLTNTSTARPDFEAPLTTTIDLSRGIGSATYSRPDGADRRATVTDFEGLIHPVKNGEARFEGARRVENLATYSEDASNTSGWGIAAVTVTSNAAIAPDGTMTADRVDYGSGNNGLDVFDNKVMALSGVAIPVRKFVGTIYLKGEGTDIGKQIRVDLRRNSGTYVSTGYQTITLTGAWQRVSTETLTTLSDTVGLIFYIGEPTTSYASTVLVWGAQVEEVTGQANQNPSEYVSTNVKTASPYHGANVDGVKYFATQNGNTVASHIVTEATGTAIPDATLRGFLAEGQRVNYQIYSEDMSNWATNGSVTLLSDDAMAPDGRTTADKLNGVSLASDGTLKGGTLSANTAFSLSGFFKQDTSLLSRFGLWDVTGSDWQGYLDIAWSSGTPSTSASSGASSIEYKQYANGWWRVSFVCTSDVTNTSHQVHIHPDRNNTQKGIWFWGAQLEAALFPSSYIPTTTASVTRASDALSYPETGNFDSTVGTLSVDAIPNFTGGNGTGTAWIGDSHASGGGQNIGFWHWSGQTNHIAASRNAEDMTRNELNYASGAITSGTMLRLAESWTSTDVKLFSGGVLRGSDTTLTLPYGTLTGNLYIGSSVTNAYAFSTIKNVRAWKKAMSDTFLTNLTSPTQSISASAIKQSTRKGVNTIGLVGYWSFDENTGTQAGDGSGNNNTGTLTNGPTWVTGKLGQAVNFDGVDDSVRVASLDNASFPTSGALSFWIKASTMGNDAGKIFDVYDGARDHIFIRFCSSGNGSCSGASSGNRQIQVVFQKSDSTYKYNVTNTFSENTWVYMTIVWDTVNDTGRVYQNGVQIHSGAITDSTWTPSSQTATFGGSNFPGILDDIRIYNRILSNTEITNLYNLGSAKLNTTPTTNLTSGLVGYWTFDGKDTPWSSSSAGTATDRSGNSNTGTLTNMSRATSITEGKLGQALTFDGTDDYVNMGDPVSGSLDMGTNNFSLSIWVKSADTTNTEGLISKGQNNFTANGLDLLKRHGAPYNGLYMRLSDSSSSAAGQVTPSSDLTSTLWDGNWHYVVVTIDRAGSGVIYVDGTSRGSANISSLAGSVSNSDTFLIGAGRQDNSTITYRFPGSIDEVRVYNRALSSTEVSALYNSGR